MREILRLAGYRITTETGSALVAANDETSFYVWTTGNAAEEVVQQEPHWQRLATIAGTSVYGDRRVWRFWSAQGFIFWIAQGPTATAVLPSPVDLQPLIEASKRVRPPQS